MKKKCCGFALFPEHVSLAYLLSSTNCPALLERTINDQSFEFVDDFFEMMCESKECLIIIGKKDINLLDKFSQLYSQAVPETLIQEVKAELRLIFSKKSARK